MTRSILFAVAAALFGGFAAVAGARLPPAAPRPTQTLGAFVTPVDVQASSAQTGAARTARKLIDGSGWGDAPGSGVWVHTSNVGENGASMWNGDPNSVLTFDLGQARNLSGAYIWNYNEAGGWNTRGVKEFNVSASLDGKMFAPVGAFTLALAPGTENDPGQAVAFGRIVQARFIKFSIRSNYRNGEQSGLAEVRFASADEKAKTGVVAWKPTYSRPQHPRLRVGQALAGAENIVYPADAGIVDVTQAPYFAKGDGKTDDTQVIQRALDDHPNQGAIIYLPNGVYLVSDTLRWPAGGPSGGGGDQKQVVLQGQSRVGTVIQLKDGCPGFDNPRKPRSPIWTGQAPAQRFGNEIHNLTIDTGVGNPGACGMQFIANNQGGVWNVTIISGDGQGVFGLDMGYTDEQGPCLIKNVKVVGFDVGVHVATSVASETLEHITVERQNKAGFQNDGQPCTVRGLHSVNDVPAFIASGGFSVLVDSVLSGATKAAATQPAIVAEAPLVVRNVRATGYQRALADRRAGNDARRDVAGSHVNVWLSKPATSLFGTPGEPLNLPIRETPAVPWDDPKTWVAPQRFGAKTNDGVDDSQAIQQTIDAGASTVYLPRGVYHIGGTITVRGSVRRIVGCKAWLETLPAFRKAANPVFRFADGTAPTVTLEGVSTDFSSGSHFFLENNARRTLVLRRLGINFGAADAYHGEGPGTVFLEDVVGRWFRFKNQTVWARQFNPEGDGLHVLNDGGALWILGLKTEGGGTLVETRNGGQTEILGSFSYTVGPGKMAPMFVITGDNSRAAFSFAEVNYSGDPFATIVREIRNAETRELFLDDPRWGGHFTLFTAGDVSSRPARKAKR